jgi:hypothetical protein
MKTSQQFQSIDTIQLLDTINAVSKRAGLDLTMRPSYKGVHSFSYGDNIISPDGSVLKPQLFLRNINDGGHALMIGIGLYRFVCMNGLTIGDDFFSRRIIHRKGDTLDGFLSTLEGDLTAAFQIAATQQLESLTRLYDTKINDATAFQIIGSLKLATGVKDTAIRTWANPRAEDSSSSLLSLYNIVNEMNRRKSNSTSAFDLELSLMGNIELLHAHEVFKAA